MTQAELYNILKSSIEAIPVFSNGNQVPAVFEDDGRFEGMEGTNTTIALVRAWIKPIDVGINQKYKGDNQKFFSSKYDVVAGNILRTQAGHDETNASFRIIIEMLVDVEYPGKNSQAALLDISLDVLKLISTAFQDTEDVDLVSGAKFSNNGRTSEGKSLFSSALFNFIIR